MEYHILEGIQAPIYAVAQTVADCFKLRYRVGLDVALEALTDAGRQHRLTLAELNYFTGVNCVQRVMQPYAVY